MNRISFKYTPHLLETNDIVVYLKKQGKIEQNFQLESKIGSKSADLMLNLGENKLYIEVDLSEKDWKKEIQRQYKAYQKAKVKRVMYYSNRWKKLRKWISEIYEGEIDLLWSSREPKNIGEVI